MNFERNDGGSSSVPRKKDEDAAAAAVLFVAKEKARRRNCKVRFSLIQKNKAFQKSYVKVSQEVATSGYGTCKNVVNAMQWRWPSQKDAN